MSRHATSSDKPTAVPPPDLLAAGLSFALDRLAQKSDPGPLILGLCGAQGSGKTTLAKSLIDALASADVPAATLSLDDLYLTRESRLALAESVHPLLATRGVPGTHDVELGLGVLDRLRCGVSTLLPRFDKARDNRLPREQWRMAPEGCRVLVFEGWCVGARPQAAGQLETPVNALERNEDADCRWRSYVNARLACDYQILFGRLDALVLLAAPSFDVVSGWRLQQEQDLAKAHPSAGAVMDAAGVSRFIQFYERLTRHMLDEMPPRADLLVRLGPDRELLSLSGMT